MQVKRPIGRNNLDKQLHRLFPSDAEYLEMRSMMANVIVGQFLPPGVVKGGSSLKLRFVSCHSSRLSPGRTTSSPGSRRRGSENCSI